MTVVCYKEDDLIISASPSCIIGPIADLDSETMAKVKEKIDNGWDIHLKED